MDEKELDADCARREAQKAGYGHQDVLNGRRVPERRLQVDAPAPVPVVVRVHWERDGWQTLEGFALGWVNRRGLDVLGHDVGDSRWQECGWGSVADCSMGSMVVVVDVPDSDGGGALGF